jgi:hypothetical protein
MSKRREFRNGTGRRTWQRTWKGCGGMASRGSSITLVLVLVLGATGCGGESQSNGDGDGTFSSGVPGSTRLSELSDRELDAFCERIEEFTTTPPVSTLSEEYLCRVAGMLQAAFAGATTDAEARASCAATYDQCQASNTSSTTTCNRPSPSCTATVAEYEACMNDMPGYLEDTLEVLPTCETLTLADITSDTLPVPETPASCVTLQEKCPDET